MPKRENSAVRYHACMGLLGIYGEDIEDICSKLEKINSVFGIYNPEGEDLLIHYDDYAALRDEYYEGLKQFGC